MRRRTGRVPALALLTALAAVRCASTPAPPSLLADGTYALRDPLAGAGVELAPRDEKLLSEAMAELRSGEVAGAREDFAKGEERAAEKAPFRLGAAYADLLAGRDDGARAALDALLSAAPEWTAALEARGDLAARAGALRDALELYHRALRTLPDDARLQQRAALLTERIAAPLAAEAEAALESRDVEAARRAGFALAELDPKDPRGFRTLAEAAAQAERWDDAYRFAELARGLAPLDAHWTARTAEIASRSGRHGEAAELWEKLAAGSPEAAGKSASERLAFRLQNLPETARRAALSPKLTRSQAAALAYWLVPEVRESPVPAGTEVAMDVVDRPDRVELVRAIALGLLPVSGAHRVHPDAALSKAELAAFLRRLAAFVAQGRKLPACLSGDASAAALHDCGILPDSSGRSTSGEEAVGAVERTVRAGREGARR